MSARKFAAALLLALTVPLIADDASPSNNAAPATNTAPSTNAAPSTAPAPDASAVIRHPVGDVGFGSDGAIKDADSYQARIGELYAPGGESYILPFLIPALGAGQKVATAHLRFQLYGIATEPSGLANADLYALGVRDSNKPVAGDYYQGAKPDPKATMLQANFLTPSSKVRADQATGPFIETSADGDAALIKFLNDAFSKPENAGKYVMLRISYDADTIPDGNNAYMLLTTGASGDNETPTLTYTLTPAK